MIVNIQNIEKKIRVILGLVLLLTYAALFPIVYQIYQSYYMQNKCKAVEEFLPKVALAIGVASNGKECESLSADEFDALVNSKKFCEAMILTYKLEENNESKD